MHPAAALALQRSIGNRAFTSLLSRPRAETGGLFNQKFNSGGFVLQAQRAPQHGSLPARRGLARPSAKTQRLIRAVRLFRQQAQQAVSKEALEGFIVRVLRGKSTKFLEDFDWMYRREHGIGVLDEIENLIKSGKLDPRIKTRLRMLFPPAGGLDESKRQQAIAIARGLKGKWPSQWVPVTELAQWMFKDSVWTQLNAKLGGGVGYTRHYVSGAATDWLFTPPYSDEIRTWQTGGAEAFMRRIAKNIDTQLYNFSHDIGWFLTPRGTMMAGAEVLIGLKKTITEYQKLWETLGKGTGTLSDIKSMLPGNFMKYLWSEAERQKLKLWGARYGKAP